MAIAMTSNGNIGLADYSHVGSKPGQDLAKILEKCRLRSELAALQAEIDFLVTSLNPAEIGELQNIMALEIAKIDDDAMRQINREGELAKTTNPAQVRISRRASQALAAEALRRIERGTYPSSSGLASEAKPSP